MAPSMSGSSTGPNKPQSAPEGPAGSSYQQEATEQSAPPPASSNKTQTVPNLAGRLTSSDNRYGFSDLPGSHPQGSSNAPPTQVPPQPRGTKLFSDAEQPDKRTESGNIPQKELPPSSKDQRDTTSKSVPRPTSKESESGRPLDTRAAPSQGSPSVPKGAPEVSNDSAVLSSRQSRAPLETKKPVEVTRPQPKGPSLWAPGHRKGQIRKVIEFSVCQRVIMVRCRFLSA